MQRRLHSTPSAFVVPNGVVAGMQDYHHQISQPSDHTTALTDYKERCGRTDSENLRPAYTSGMGTRKNAGLNGGLRSIPREVPVPPRRNGEGRVAEAPSKIQDLSPVSRDLEHRIRFDAARFAQIGAQHGVQAASPCSQQNAENKIYFFRVCLLKPEQGNHKADR